MLRGRQVPLGIKSEIWDNLIQNGFDLAMPPKWKNPEGKKPVGIRRLIKKRFKSVKWRKTYVLKCWFLSWWHHVATSMMSQQWFLMQK